MNVHQQLRLDLIRMLLPTGGGDIGKVLEAAARAERFVLGNPTDGAGLSASADGFAVPLRPTVVTGYRLGADGPEIPLPRDREPGHGNTLAGDTAERHPGPRYGEPGYGDTMVPGLS